MQPKLFAVELHHRAGRVVQNACQPHRPRIANLHRERGPYGDRRGRREYHDICIAVRKRSPAARHAFAKRVPGFALIGILPLNPRNHDFPVGRHPAAIHNRVVFLCRGPYLGCHLPILLFKLRIFATHKRRQLAENIVEIELVPAAVSDHFRKTNPRFAVGRDNFLRGLLLALQLAPVSGGERNALGNEVFAQQPRLPPAEIGERVVISASARLTVPDQIDSAQKFVLSISDAANRVSLRTRLSKSRNRAS